MGCPCAGGLGKSLNTYEGPIPPGVPNPYTVMLHSYPTRYHGPIYTRPEFGLPWAPRPNDFALEPPMMGLGEDEPPPTNQGVKALAVVAVGLLVTWAYVKYGPQF